MIADWRKILMTGASFAWISGKSEIFRADMSRNLAAKAPPISIPSLHAGNPNPVIPPGKKRR
jgi:hypothetical protein